MNIFNLDRTIGLALCAIFLAIFSVSCVWISPSPTPTPTPTQVPTPTPSEITNGDSGFGEPDPDSLPEAVAPHGLGEISLPDQAQEITAMFDSLPPELIGRTRTEELPGTGPGEINASYGKTEPAGCRTVGFQAMNVSTGDFFPQGWTAERVIAVFTTGADWDVEDFGRDGDLFWVMWNTTCSFETPDVTDSIWITSWGNSGSPWVISASAGDPEGRDELTAAYVMASR